ncbi:HNH endonuclease signature motif containing protein [Devosia sp.]|uniref:HNH endonuclease signature motif containing protein n=1 Tax=Devosia sp. TaxID=1871048 RepID=UPI002FC8D7A8
MTDSIPALVGLTQERLKELLHYDPDAGVFTWVVSRGRQAAGNVAGSVGGRGYVDISVDGLVYKAHRLAWLYLHGHMPQDHVDHINGDKTDYRIANLRLCTAVENHQNRVSHKGATSMFLGVSSLGRHRKRPWRAVIRANGKSRHLGTYLTEQEASAAYQSAKAAMHSFNPIIRGAANEG